MTHIEIDACDWKTEDDFYAAISTHLGAPEWHGTNTAALIDSIVGDDMNELRRPFTIKIVGMDRTAPIARKELTQSFRALVRYGAELHISDDLAVLTVPTELNRYPYGAP